MSGRVACLCSGLLVSRFGGSVFVVDHVSGFGCVCG